MRCLRRRRRQRRTYQMPGNCRAFFSCEPASAAGIATAFRRNNLALPSFDGFLLPQALAHISNQRIFGGLSSDAQVCAVRLDRSRALETFALASLVVINGGENRIRGHVVLE